MWQFEVVATSASASDVTPVETISNAKWNIVPNPVKRGSTIIVENITKPVQIKCFNLSGKLLMERIVIDKLKIDLLPGMYYLRVSDGREVETKKLLVK